jgi:hypothetical protein
LTFYTEREPSFGTEINCLTDIEPCREPTVVGTGKSQDELSWSLECLENFYALRLEISWRNHRDDVEQNVRVFLEKE